MKKSKKNIEMDILQQWFEKYPYMKFITLGAKGTFYKYECAGETYENEADSFWRYGRDFDVDEALYYNEDTGQYDTKKMENDATIAYNDLPEINISLFFNKTPERGGEALVAYYFKSSTKYKVRLEYKFYDPE